SFVGRDLTGELRRHVHTFPSLSPLLSRRRAHRERLDPALRRRSRNARPVRSGDARPHGTVAHRAARVRRQQAGRTIMPTSTATPWTRLPVATPALVVDCDILDANLDEMA